MSKDLTKEDTKSPSLPFIPRLVIPRIPNPTCPEHCNGRHERDGVLVCPTHKTSVYEVIAHGWFHDDGHYFFTINGMNGAGPVQTKNPVCGDCGKLLERRWV